MKDLQRQIKAVKGKVRDAEDGVKAKTEEIKRALRDKARRSVGGGAWGCWNR